MEIIVTHVARSSLAGREQRIPGARVRIGRRPDNDVAFDADQDRAVSGYHVEVTVEGDALHLRDLGSNNGTFVNGAQVKGMTVVPPGAVVRLGEAGPELTLGLKGGGTAKSKGIGEATLIRHFDAERGRTRTTIGVVAIALGLLIAATAVGYGVRARGLEEGIGAAKADAASAKEDAAAARRIAEETSARLDEGLRAAIARHEEQLGALEGKLSAGETRVARLVVEMNERDRALHELKNDGRLAESSRAELAQQTERRLAALREELLREQQALRAGQEGVWADLAERYREGVFLVVAQDPAAGTQGIGTAFVIDGKGVLATNSHVVGMFDQLPVKVVVQNGTGKVFPVRRWKAHPGYNGTHSPDVALIDVDLGGARVPVLPLASSQELEALRIGTHLATLGYPGELGSAYLSSVSMQGTQQVVSTAQATFKDGWVGRMTDFTLASGPAATCQLIQHSASLSGGTSGSPMFTSDGKVVAINNSGIDYQVVVAAREGGGPEQARTPSAAEIGWGIRVDLVADLKRQSGW